MSEAMYCRAVVPEIRRAEKAKRWPGDCIVCLRERHKIVTSQNLAEALAHREREHSWLADALRPKRKRP